MKKGDRVNNKLLGDGTIERVLLMNAYIVLFDKTPPKRYNNGTNPCFQLPNDLTLIN
jgi:hypothetical protein